MAGVPSFWLLVFVSALGPISMNSVLPANVAIMEDLAVSYGQAQLVLTVYLISMLVFQLVSGSLSDRFGRRSVVIGGLAFFVAGSVLCSTAQSIEWSCLAVLYKGLAAQFVLACPEPWCGTRYLETKLLVQWGISAPL